MTRQANQRVQLGTTVERATRDRLSQVAHDHGLTQRAIIIEALDAWLAAKGLAPTGEPLKLPIGRPPGT